MPLSGNRPEAPRATCLNVLHQSPVHDAQLTEDFSSCIFLLWRPACARKLEKSKNSTDLLRLKRGLFLWRNDMTKLPEKTLLDGSKLPKTTTGEMKDALGKIRDYLNDLLGEDSADRETARLALGIDLAELRATIGKKADKHAIETTIETAMQDKIGKTELENRAQMLEAEIAKRGIPVGSIDWLAVTAPPAGYLKADGSAVGRTTYPELFFAIGTTFGDGDGETTFNLPDLMGRFAEGSAIPGTVKKAGLPNITGALNTTDRGSHCAATGALAPQLAGKTLFTAQTSVSAEANGFTFDASRSSPVYGASSTVQPPSLTLLPCIKAFDAPTGTGLIDITGLAQETARKANTSLDNVSPNIDYVAAQDNNGVYWWRVYRSGWVEQGNVADPIPGIGGLNVNLLIPLGGDYGISATSQTNVSQPVNLVGKAPTYFTVDYENANISARFIWRAWGWKHS